jgi:hypothetical protein
MVIPPAGRDPVFCGVVVIFGDSSFIHSMAMLRGSIAAGLRE